MRLPRVKKSKRVQTYAELHNGAVKAYKKCCLVLIWVAVLNIFSAIFGVFNIGASAKGENGINYRYSLTLTLNRFIFDVLEKSNVNEIVVKLMIVLIAIMSGLLFVLLGRFASMGKIKYLITAISVYLFDFAMQFVYDNILSDYFGNSFNWTLYMFSLVTHIVVLGFLVFGILNYYKVIVIENNKNKQEECKEIN